MSNLVTIKAIDLITIQGEMFKIQALARSIEALFDANGTARYEGSDRFCEDDMTPLAKIIEKTAIECLGMLDLLNCGHSLKEEPEDTGL